MIPDHKIEEIRDTADIVEIVSDYVKLKRSGKNFLGLCPFHNEKTPSFNVSPELGIYKCFGCDASGDVFNFIQELEGVGFVEAAKTLAERYNIELPDDNDPADQEEITLKEGIYHALRFAGVYYYRMLAESDEGDVARRYLQERKYEWRTIKKYGLGYAPEKGESLYRAALDAGIREKYLVEAGLIRERRSGNGFYDVFRGRLMFPIFNPSGKVIAFAGRIMDGSKQAKYINSSQTPVYNKSEVIYAINFAKQEIRRNKEAILVEGYTDVITLHQAGVKQAVATSGTALTEGQMKIIHRYGEKLVMVYDSDTAGFNAMKRGINLALKEGLTPRLLGLPEGEDPDSFVKQFGGESFLELKKENERDFIDFMIEQAEYEGRWDDPAGKQQVISDLLESIAHIGDGVKRESYLQYLNQKVHMGDRILQEELAKKRQEVRDNWSRTERNRERYESNPRYPSGESVPAHPASAEAQDRGNKESKSRSRPPKKPSYEKELIRLMLVYPAEMIEYIGHLCNEEQFEDDELRAFFEDIMERHSNELDVTIQHYAQREQPYPKLVGEVVMEAHSISERLEREGIQAYRKDRYPFKTAKGALKALQLHYLDRLRNEYNKEYRDVSDPEEKRELMELINEVGRQRNLIQNTPDDELFKDPELPDSGHVNDEFEEFMKNWQNQ